MLPITTTRERASKKRETALLQHEDTKFMADHRNLDDSNVSIIAPYPHMATIRQVFGMRWVETTHRRLGHGKIGQTMRRARRLTEVLAVPLATVATLVTAGCVLAY